MEALKQQLLSLEYWETSFSGIASRLIKHALKTYASLTILPYLSTIVSYKLLITDALCLGNSSQENCVPRSSLIGMACRVLYLWLFVKMDVWQSSVLFHCHQKEGFYFTGCCLVKQKQVIPLIFQTVFGIFHGFQHYVIFESTFEQTVCEDQPKNEWILNQLNELFFCDKDSGTAERVESNSRWTFYCCCGRMLALRCCAGLSYSSMHQSQSYVQPLLELFIFGKHPEQKKCNRNKDSLHKIIKKINSTLNSNVIKYKMVMRYDQLLYKH